MSKEDFEHAIKSINTHLQALYGREGDFLKCNIYGGGVPILEDVTEDLKNIEEIRNNSNNSTITDKLEYSELSYKVDWKFYL